MPKNKTIFFDCDHVLLDTQKSFAKYMRRTYKLPISAYEEKHTFIDNWENFKDQTIKWKLGTLESWQKTKSFENIPALHGARTAIQKFKKAGYNLIIVTAAGHLPIAKQRREKNIEKIFGPVFDDIIMTSWNSNKNMALKKFTPSFFIEDNIKNAVNALEINFKPILIKNSQNKNLIEARKNELKEVKIASSWKEITDYILG